MTKALPTPRFEQLRLAISVRKATIGHIAADEMHNGGDITKLEDNNPATFKEKTP